MTGDNDAVDRHQAARIDQYAIADAQFFDRNLVSAVGTADGHGARQKVQQIANRPPATRNRQVLEYFGDQHEQGDDERGEELGNRGCCQDRNRHREFHRHPARGDVLDCLFEDRPAANQDAGHADETNPRERLPDAEPHSYRAHCDQADSQNLKPVDDLSRYLDIADSTSACS